MQKINLDNILTESRNNKSKNLDSKSTINILKIINKEDKKITKAIKNEIKNITNLTNIAFDVIFKNGRVFYIGAGSSGRIGVLDASEMLPTYGVKDKFIGIIAGGDIALRTPVEGAEDSKQLAIADLKSFKFSKNDFVIAIGASGRTPYCIGALEYANKIGAKNAAICMTQDSEFRKYTNNVVEILTGPEVVTGSTRMKAGTATKLVVNMISTTVMVKLGKVYDNLMIDLQATNLKLENRCVKIIGEITGLQDRNLIIETLKNAEMKVKPSIVMILKNLNYNDAKKLLLKNNDSLREALENE